MIKLVGVSKRFGNECIVENLHLELNKQKIKIKGENGTGKSVLLKMIVGYCVPEQGRIFFDQDKELRKDADFIQDAGIFINAPQFMRNWTGLENLLYLRNITGKCSEEKMIELVKFFQLEEDIKKKYKTYSLGMRQKLRLIQALLDEPRYLILDEPFDGLDKEMKKKVKNYLDAYVHEHPNRMLIYTSHDEEDDVFANQCYLLEDTSCVEC